MRKKHFVTISLFILMVFLLNMSTYAQGYIYGYEPNIQVIETGFFYNLYVNDVEIETAGGPVDYGQRTLVPVRSVVEALGGTVDWDDDNDIIQLKYNDIEVEYSINSYSAKVNGSARMMPVVSTAINGNSVICLEFLCDIFSLNARVSSLDQTVKINIPEMSDDLTGIKTIRYFSKDDYDKVTIETPYVDDFAAFWVAEEDDRPNRIAIRVFGADKLNGSNTIDVNSENIEDIRYVRYDADIVGIAFDLKETPQYYVASGDGFIVFHIGNVEKSGDNWEGIAIIPEITTNGEPLEKEYLEAIILDPEEEADEDDIPDIYETSKQGDSTIIKIYGIELSSPTMYDISGSSDGTKKMIAYDTAELSFKESVNSINDGLVKYISFKNNIFTGRSQINVGCEQEHLVSIISVADSGFTTITITPLSELENEENNNTAEEQITVENMGKIIYGDNFVYSSKADRVFMSIKGARLSEGYEEYRKNYTQTMNDTTCVITFNNDYAYVPSGYYNVDDHILNSISIVRSSETGYTSITFIAKEEFTYFVMARPDINDTAITILKPAKEDEKLIVIDPGHGGRDPGAIYGSLYESSLNLDISLRIEEYLENKGYSVYLTRQDDSFIGIYERAFLANELNAHVFVSIHNNALLDPDYGGTMTYCFPSSLSGVNCTGKYLAQCIQNNLGELPTSDRGVQDWADLIVLKTTTMPSALTETAFITNYSDREKLLDESFRQMAAIYICEGIITYIENTD